jgi:hypothetical protein
MAPRSARGSRLATGFGFFKGRELPHFREALPEGRSSWSIFLHFIPAPHSTGGDSSWGAITR